MRAAAESIDYEAVLADLRDKRASLDAAIAAIEQLVLGRPVVASEPAEVAEAHQPAAPASSKIDSDSFFGMSAADAAKKFLRMVKRPQQGKAIHDALLEGGFTTTAKNFYSNLYTAMMRSDDIVNLGGTKGWGLAEWYPGRRFEQQSKGKAGEKAEKPTEDEGRTSKVAASPKPNGAASPEAPDAPAPEPSAVEQPDGRSPRDVAN